MRIEVMCILVCCFLCALPCRASEKTISAKELEIDWIMYGHGRRIREHGILLLQTKRGGKDICLLSPDSYSDKVVLQCEIMTLNSLTSIDFILAVAQVKGDKHFSLPTGYDGSLQLWQRRYAGYILSLANAAENRTPVLIKSPGWRQLQQAKKNYFIPGVFNKIEVGRKRDKLWLLINDEEVLKFDDDHDLAEGRLVIHIGGAFGEEGGCLLRNMRITTRP